MTNVRRNTTFQGAQLRRARREKKLSQAELAERLGVHRTTLIRWESDLGDPPTGREEEIAKILDKPVGYFHQPIRDPMSVEWLTDAWLKMTPPGRLQQLTAGALRCISEYPTELAERTRFPVERIEQLLDGALPTLQEIQALRDKLGEEFNPTATLGRTVQRASGGRPPAPQAAEIEAKNASPILAGLTLEEKLDLLLSRQARIEKSLILMEHQLGEILSRLT